MNPEDEKYPKSPHKSSIPPISSTQQEQISSSPQQLSSSGNLSMQDLSFHSSFPFSFMEFETDPLYFKENTVSEGVPSMTTGGNRDGADGDVGEGEEEEDIGEPRSHPHGGLQGNPVPPFLSKTYDLVDDRTLDPIISWGSKGKSFIVWDPVEFARIILPRNFKHSNFSSFVRQLNTYGFRKIDADRWEFANEAFKKGERYLLKTIQRRKSPHAGPPTEAGKSGLQNEVERLRTERSVMMQEVVELQHQQHGTVHQMEAVNQRLQAAEQRQKQMLSFLAKLFQNPAFLAHLKQKKEQGVIGSSRMKKKFIKHQQHEPGQSGSDLEGQIVKYRPDWRNLPLSSVVPDTNPVPFEQSPNYVLQDMVDRSIGVEGVPFPIDNVASDELAITDELEATQGFIKSPEYIEGLLSLKSEDPNFKGKNVMSPQRDIDPRYFVSFSEDLGVEKSFPEFTSPGIESIVKQEDVWSMGFDTSAGMSSSTNMLWGNLVNYDMPELGLTGGLSDIWDTGSVQAVGGSGIDKWPTDENPVDESKDNAGQPLDDKSKNIDP